jgi:hypothetical protein
MFENMNTYNANLVKSIIEKEALIAHGSWSALGNAVVLSALLFNSLYEDLPPYDPLIEA